MLRLAIAFALVLTLGVTSQATSPCANGQCRKPVRNAIQAVPTLAAPRRPHPIVVKPSEGQRSVVVQRSRGPGLWARITFRPGRR